jgi:hypothetical protein
MTTDAATGPPEDGPVKPCSKCGLVKPLTEFNRMVTSRDGHRPDCKSCGKAARQTPEARSRHREYERNRRATDEKYRQARAESRRRGQARATEYQRTRRLDAGAREDDRQADARRRDKLRKQVFDRYGWTCACCGATENLTIDHPDGNGAEHRKELFGRQQGGHIFYRWLIQQGLPDGYQTLCQPCNDSKKRGTRCLLWHGDPAFRRCTSCLEVKLLAEFPPQSRRPGGKSRPCRACGNRAKYVHNQPGKET